MDIDMAGWAVLAGILGAASGVGVVWGGIDMVRDRAARRDGSLWFLISMLAANFALCAHVVEQALGF